VTGAANRLVLPEAAGQVIVADVARYGCEQLETGGFMLAPVGTDSVTAIARAGTKGIVRRRELFQVSELALDALFARAEAHELWIPAQYHSHGLGAFMSDCDVEHGLSVAGFISVIVPFFANPPRDPSAWGWWRFDGDWITLAPSAPMIGEVAVSVFDEDGVRGS
jgi:hypothetical protein